MDIGALGSISAFVIMTVVLISASISDWREREVSDTHWLIIGIAGIAIFSSSVIFTFGFRWEYILMIVGSLMILADILWDRVGNVLLFYAAMAVLFIVAVYSGSDDPVIMAWATVPVCYLIFTGMYVFRVLRGGADAKCLIVLSMMFPVYPSFLSFPLISTDTPMSGIFVFPISVLFVAAGFVAVICVYFALVNVRNGDICGRMFSGYRMDIDRAERSHVWPIEDMVDGESVRIGIPDDGSEVFLRLRSAGCGRVWVTPMVPFIIPITAASVFVALIGNPLFLIG